MTNKGKFAADSTVSLHILVIIISITTAAAAINNNPSLGLSYSYLWDYSNTYKYYDTHILSIYGGLPVIKDRVSIGLTAGIDIPFVNKSEYQVSHEYLYIGSDTNIYKGKSNSHSIRKSINLSVSLPVTLYVNSFFLETAIGAIFNIDREINDDTATYYNNSPQGYIPFDKKIQHSDDRFLSFSNLVIYSLGYQLNHFQFMITGRGFLSVGFEIRFLYWKR